MTAEIRMRWLLAAIGALAGAVLYALIEAADGNWFDGRILIPLFTASAAFFGGTLAMAGTISVPRAIKGAALIALVVGALTFLSIQRFDDATEMFNTGYSVLALLGIAMIPLPFLIANGGPGWRDYPALFDGIWAILVRGAVAGLFTGVIWAVIALSDALLQIVGIGLVTDIAYRGMVPYLITGAGFGLALGVVLELSNLISARLVVQLLRLLAPVVLAVSVVFVVAAPIQGLSNLFQGWSAAGVLIAMGFAGLTFLTLIVDRDDEVAPKSPVLIWSARGLAIVLPVLGLLAVWAIAQRVGQYGWTPDRLFALMLAGVVAAYGLLHALAVVRGGKWHDRIRTGNLRMALVVLALCVLWLTPVLNAERISARSLVARALSGQALGTSDLWELRRWGKAGVEAEAELKEAAKDPARAELAAWLAEEAASSAAGKEISEAEATRLRAEIAAILPLQPASATGTRDSYLMLMQPWELQEILQSCQLRLPGGEVGCAMVVADLLPALPGEELGLALERGGWATLDGLYLLDGYVVRQSLRPVDGRVLEQGDIHQVLLEWQATPPPVARTELNQLGTGKAGLILLP